jgi:hypothetical protein
MRIHLEFTRWIRQIAILLSDKSLKIEKCSCRNTVENFELGSLKLSLH